MPFMVASTILTFLDKDVLILSMFVDDILLLVRSSYFELLPMTVSCYWILDLLF